MRMRSGVVAAALALGAMAAVASANRRTDLAAADDWAVVLQAPDLEQIAEEGPDLVVIDYSYDGSESGEFTHDEIETLRDSDRTVLSYFSIGEAEDYRFYWRDSWDRRAPAFLDEENPNWDGNYKVRYWHRSWRRQAIGPYIDRIVDAGFDGVYLDLVDAYYWWSKHGEDREVSANRMTDLVRWIAARARRRGGRDFLIVPQNGLAILEDAAPRRARRYLRTIDAVGIESLQTNVYSADDQAYRMERIADVNDAGKRAFSIEYVRSDQHADVFAWAVATDLELTPYPAAADRQLEQLVVPSR